MICQPAELKTAVKIPPEIKFWGIDSGIRHSVGAGDYGSVRTGAFIGYAMIADLAALNFCETEIDGVVQIEDDKWSGYLANITPAEFEKTSPRICPKKLTARNF